MGSSPFTRTSLKLHMRKWLSGRASPCQGEGREFESRLPLQQKADSSESAFFVLLEQMAAYFDDGLG